MDTCYHAYKNTRTAANDKALPCTAGRGTRTTISCHTQPLLLALVVHCKCCSLHCYRSRVNGGLEDARRLSRCCEIPVRSHFSWTTYPKSEILIFSIKLDLHTMKFSCYVVPQVIREGNEKHPSSLMSYQVNIIAWPEHNRMSLTWTYCWLSQHWLRVLFHRISVHRSGTPHHHWSEGLGWSSTACSNKQEKKSVNFVSALDNFLWTSI